MMMTGASSLPTPYRVRTPTGTHFVRCGADLLLNGLSADLEAEGQCPVCETTVHFQVRSRQVRELRPETAILHVVEIPTAEGEIGIECEASPIFDKEVCLRAWLYKYHGRPSSILKPQAFLNRMIIVRKPHAGQA